MPLEDEIIPDEKPRANQGDALHNFLDSAQNVLAEAVAKSAAEKVVDGMFSPGHQPNRGATQSGGPPQEGIYPDLDKENDRNREPSFMDTAQNAFADAFAKKAAEKVVDGILPTNRTNQPEGNHERPVQSHSGFDLSNLGSSLLESFADQMMHPSEKQSNQQQRYSQQPQGQGKEQSGLDFNNMGSELLGLAEQMLHSQGQKQQSGLRQPQAQGENQSGFDFNKVSSELLSSLAEQVMHPEKKGSEQQNPQLSQNQGNNQSGFDFSKVSSELLSSLAEQVMHPEKKGSEQQNPQFSQNQGNNQSGFDFSKVSSELLSALAEQVMHPEKKASEQQNPQLSQHNKENNQSGFDISKVGAEFLESLAEQVLHPSDKKENASVQHQSTDNYRGSTNQQGGGDIAAILGSLAENVLRKQNPENDNKQSTDAKPHTLAGEIASSVLGSLAESMLHKNSNNESQYQDPRGYGPPQWYGPPGPQGYGPGPQGYWPGPQGYGPPQGNWPDSERGLPANPREPPLSEDIGSFSSNRQSNMPMPPVPASGLSYGPDNGLYPNLDSHFHPGPGIRPPQPGLHPPMPSNLPSGGIVPPPHIPQGMPQPSISPSIRASCPSPAYPDAAHAPFPTHPGSMHHDSAHSPFPDVHSHLSRRDLKKISKAEYKMEKEIYKAQKKAEKKAYKAHKKALKKQNGCSHCNHKGSCSCSSSSSD